MKTLPTILAVSGGCGCLVSQTAQAWSPNPFSGFMSLGSCPRRTTISLDNDDPDDKDVLLHKHSNIKNRDEIHETRRRFLNAAAMNVCFLGAAAPAIAAAAADGPTVYISGKTPQVPGAKPPDKNNVKGTRKDPDFLRSIADCRSQCQNSASGPDGFAKSKEDCLSECQDICCRTYEQCTFNIVPRI